MEPTVKQDSEPRTLPTGPFLPRLELKEEVWALVPSSCILWRFLWKVLWLSTCSWMLISEYLLVNFCGLCNKSFLSNQPASHPSWFDRTLMLDITCKLLNQILFTPAMLMGTIDFYLFFIQLLLWLWPCLGVTRSAQSRTSWLHFLTHFSNDQDEI